ncbi:MAG: hypothetical protein PHO27_12195 [Sulfuricurvum sp.]|jgi:nitrogen fixation protein FixH|nr:hypothetical protein [Sulfuricurvum sp.]
MSGYSLFDYVVLIVSGLIIGYIAIRVWMYGVFRSYFEAKKQHNKKSKEETKNGSTKQEANAGEPSETTAERADFLP